MLLTRNLLARPAASTLRRSLASQRGGEANGPPRIAVAITGGVGDFLVAARFLRDLIAAAGPLRFDVFSSRPGIAAWTLGGLPGFAGAYFDSLFEPLVGEYDLALRLNQFALVYQDQCNWRVMRSAPGLARVVDALLRSRPALDDLIAQHPYRDNVFGDLATFQGRTRRDALHHMAGLTYGGDRLDVGADAGAPGRFALQPGQYVTLHNGFDTNFVVSGARATKCYPHFGAVVEAMRTARPDLRFVQLGTVTSTPIHTCDQVLIGRTTLETAAGLIAGAALHIDNEGGLVHLAACLGTRAVVVFGPTPRSYFGYPGNINIDPPVCGGCWWKTRSWMDRCALGRDEPPCMAEQSPASVARQALAALGIQPAPETSAEAYAGHPDQPFGATSFAQFGEDLILLNIFHRLGVDQPSYLDIGAHHPLHCSNTALLYARGSRGLCIEPNPNLVAAFAQLRPADTTLNIGIGPAAGTLDFHMIDSHSGRNSFDRATAEAFVAEHPEFRIEEVRRIPVKTLDAVVAEYCNGVWPDLLSLDAEGLDLAILTASDCCATRGPKVICVEALSGSDADATDALTTLLAARGYVVAGRTVGNVLWAAAHLYQESG